MKVTVNGITYEGEEAEYVKANLDAFFETHGTELCARCLMEGKNAPATHHARYSPDRAIEGLCDKHFEKVTDEWS